MTDEEKSYREFNEELHSIEKHGGKISLSFQQMCHEKGLSNLGMYILCRTLIDAIEDRCGKEEIKELYEKMKKEVFTVDTKEIETTEDI